MYMYHLLETSYYSKLTVSPPGRQPAGHTVEKSNLVVENDYQQEPEFILKNTVSLK